MPWVGFKPMTLAFEWAKTVNVLYHAATVIDIGTNTKYWNTAEWAEVMKDSKQLIRWICRVSKSTAKFVHSELMLIVTIVALEGMKKGSWQCCGRDKLSKECAVRMTN
jgi:hypothetical protein